MSISRVPWVDDDGSGTTGTILNNAWLQGLYGQIDAAIGIWTPIAFVAGDFVTVGPSGAWTVTSFAINATQRIGPTLVWHLGIDASTIGTAVTGLTVKLPLSLTSQGRTFGTYGFINAGVAGLGFAEVNGTTLSLYRDALGSVPWAAGSVTIYGAFVTAVI